MRDKILKIIDENTRKGKGTNILQVSSELAKGKNLIAREMNTLVEDGVLFCVEANELEYFDKELYEINNKCVVNKKSYKSIHELNNEAEEELLDFEKLVGYQDSLSACVEQCKAAISYPQNALPTLLYGSTGTGKSYIAQLMYEYAVNNEIIESDKPFVTVNCSEYANNPELLTANLFGHKKGAFTGADKDNPGFIQVANGGVLFLDEVHCLKAECQEKLFLFMDKGIYHKVGENEKWETSNVRLIFATTEKPEDVLLKTFLRRVPITVTIPSLKDRGIYERIQLIYMSFSQESKRIEKKIKISNFVYNMFINYEFDGNIGELKNAIKVCCANALNDSDEETISIHMKHLPSSMFKKKIDNRKMVYEGDDRMMDIAELNREVDNDCKVLQLYENILKLALLDDKDSIIGEGQIKMHEYYNYLVYDKKDVKDEKSNYIMEQVDAVIEEEFKRYNIRMNNNDLLLLRNYMEDIVKNFLRIHKWHTIHDEEIEKLWNVIIALLRRETMIADEIALKLSNKLDLSLTKMFTIMLAMNLHMMNYDNTTNQRIGIIIAHGYSTASSIASAANKLLNQYIFEAIDMPIEVTTQEIIEELNSYLSKLNNYEELVLLVDMGSLEEIYKGINVDINANIGIINNITTKLALEVGNELKLNTPLEDLLKQACDLNSFNYRVIEKKAKQEVIMCACASGLGTAEKIKQLLISSLPPELPLEVITYDYNRLVDKNEKCEIFERYNIVGIIGTLNPDIDGMLFVPIEELIVDQDVEMVEQIFNKYLSKQQIEEFKVKLLKNFSLTNIMDNLTILNPTKLLEHVATALDEFQQIYGIQIRNNTCVGLYVHTCCMIERLVTHQPFDNYAELEFLETEHQDFIQCIKKSFASVEAYYGVDIPTDEIGYIFDYITNNS